MVYSYAPYTGVTHTHYICLFCLVNDSQVDTLDCGIPLPLTPQVHIYMQGSCLTVGMCHYAMSWHIVYIAFVHLKVTVINHLLLLL